MNLQEQFDRVSARYDQQRRALIPCFDDFYGIAAENMALGVSLPRILDLGAGTGLFSQFILQRYPAARLTLVDLSEQMLTVARKRFAGRPDTEFFLSDLMDLEIPAKHYDGIISSLAIHHLEDRDKQELYNRIRRGLKEGGIFVNAEQVEADTPFLKELYHTRWRERIERSGLTREELDAAYERVKLDKRTPLETQLGWLREIGFREVDCPYKYYDFCVICAIK